MNKLFVSETTESACIIIIIIDVYLHFISKLIYDKPRIFNIL